MKLTCSVIITSHDWRRAEWLMECLESVYNQTRQADNVILVGDHDRFPTMAEKLNYGISRCGTDTFIPLGDDDLLTPTFIEKTLGAMEEWGYCDIVYTDMQMFGGENRTVNSPDWTLGEIQRGNVIPITSLIRKSVWDKHPYVPIDYLDWNFWWDAFEDGKIACHLGEPLFKYRIHASQLSRNVNVEEAKKEVLRRHANS